MPDSPPLPLVPNTTFSATDAMHGILLGMLLGATGQGIRVIVGLKKAGDTAQANGSTLKQDFDPAQLVISVLIGAVAGALASLPLLSQLASLNYQIIIGLLGAGYAGADFIEGFMSKASLPAPGGVPVAPPVAPVAPVPPQPVLPVPPQAVLPAAAPAMAVLPAAPPVPASTNPIWTVGGVPVYQDPDGRVHWQSKAAVDADGSNGQNGKTFAYRKDDKGLDYLKNAGWPDGGWPNVLINEGGKPKDDGNGNWYSSTTYAWQGRPVETCYVDATTVPYVVVNPAVRIKARGVVMGCKARVTYRGISVNAVVADVSGSKDIGELSIAAAEALQFPNASPKDGGVGGGVLFEFWPDTAATINGETYQLEPA